MVSNLGRYETGRACRKIMYLLILVSYGTKPVKYNVVSYHCVLFGLAFISRGCRSVFSGATEEI